jgi:hypothetical protein
VTTALTGLSGNWSLLWNWTSDVWSALHRTIVTLPVPAITNLYQDKAYWIRMEQAGTWLQ